MKVKTGLDGGKFLVFETDCEAEEYADWLYDKCGFFSKFDCFDGYFNAIVLEPF